MTAPISCPDRLTLRRLMDGRLSPSIEQELSSHLDHCEICQKRLERIVAGGRTLDNMQRNLRGASELSEALKRVIEKCLSDPQIFAQADPPPPQKQDLSPPPETPTPLIEISGEDRQQLGHYQLGHYEILETIGRGGMGVVMKARDPKLNRIVAIKVLNASLSAEETSRLRFIREARAVAAINHRNVVTIYAVEDTAEPYLVMELIEGRTLQRHLARHQPLELRDVLRIGMQIANGLEAAHAKGVIHRDVKPENIMLDAATGRVKLMDFGLARVIGDPSLTQTGLVAGTPGFMSPEQALGQKVDHRSDLFSLGSVLYVMCTGQPPFDDDESLVALELVCKAQPLPPQQRNSAVPDWLADLIRRLHARRPEDRPAAAGDVARILKQQLEKVVGSGQSAGQPIDKTPPVAVLEPLEPVVTAALFVSLNPPEPAQTRHLATITHSPLIRPIASPQRRRLAIACAAIVGIAVIMGTLSVLTNRNPPEKKEGPAGFVSMAATGTLPALPPLVPNQNPEPQQEFAQGLNPAESSLLPFLLPNQRRRYATLAEAVSATREGGDTIEISGQIPLVIPPLVIRGKSLRIHAAPHQHPLLQGDPSAPDDSPLIDTDSDLVLEGIQVERYTLIRRGADSSKGSPTSQPLIRTVGTQFRAANCRFSTSPNADGLVTERVSRVSLRNCQFTHPAGFAISCLPHPEQKFFIQNCILHSQGGITLQPSEGPLREPRLELRGNTVVAGHLLVPHLPLQQPTESKVIPSPLAWRVFADNNLFHLFQSVLGVVNPPPPTGPGGGNSRARSQWLFQVLHWNGHRNAYSGNPQFVKLHLVGKGAWISPQWGPKTVNEWQRLWNDRETDSMTLAAHFDFLANNPLFHEDPPPALRPEDFRQRGEVIRAANGQIPGAMIEFVGPGPAYEAFRSSPDYLKWLNDNPVLSPP